MTTQVQADEISAPKESNIDTVALYVRKSRGDLEKDLEKHKSAMIAKCKHEGWKYVLYEEIGSGDSIAGRPIMQQLLQDVEEKSFDAVIGYDYARIGRGGSGDQEKILITFRNTYTYYITISPYKIFDFNNESDEQQAEIQGFISKFEYREIKRRLRDGKRNGLFAGNFVYSLAPYGYIYNPKTKGLDVDEEKYKHIRMMVEWILNGKSTYEVAWELNKLKLPSPKGGKWYHSTIQRMMCNRVYTGCIVGNKSKGASKKYREKHPNARPYERIPESKWIVVENCHKEIITEEELNKMKDIFKNRPKRRYTNQARMFSGLIKCGSCGKNIPHKTPESMCNCECGNRGGYTDIIQDAIYQTANIIKYRLENVEKDDMQKQKENNLQNKINDLEDRLAKEELAIERIEDAYEEGAYDLNRYRKKMKQREENKLELENDLKKIRKQMQVTDKNERNETISSIGLFMQDILEAKDHEAMNNLYKSIIKEIIWLKNQDATKASVTVNFL
ncbi:recombinase family protein [Halobacillus rhizosphaerae]|uniref:recombinase family protein n=1 Tax=Halobacillus rhizosphaerae TaxID=3064889 RepID=UPI00398A9EDD